MIALRAGRAYIAGLEAGGSTCHPVMEINDKPRQRNQANGSAVPDDGSPPKKIKENFRKTKGQTHRRTYQDR